ncbi:hypothetical protein J8L73_17095 [Pseudoalteromonas sp. MMG006]|uniref:hypothetical protein n=1 Tax=unclassified Pseudoalteromonas TaxID=194690 RepID=UPI001B36A6AD|nr:MULTISPECIES: hypothetical protein [unclassified Pseudoalteromonas]MBQ4800816.1 hypothetical protein [Pseudoalteromonas sp. MMG006]MBQ4859138.1 hypothetical protein [Pseudoalteromonas sp. MMG007]
MKNVNPWIISALILTLLTNIFRIWFGNTMIGFFIALILSLACIPLIKAVQGKGNIKGD